MVVRCSASRDKRPARSITSKSVARTSPSKRSANLSCWRRSRSPPPRRWSRRPKGWLQEASSVDSVIEAVTTNGRSSLKSERYHEADLEEMVAVATRVAAQAGEHGGKAFEMVLAALLRGSSGSTLPPAAHVPSRPTIRADVVEAPRPAGEQLMPSFLTGAAVTRDVVQGLIDLDTGHIIVRNLGKAKSEQQRRIAALRSEERR